MMQRPSSRSACASGAKRELRREEVFSARARAPAPNQGLGLGRRPQLPRQRPGGEAGAPGEGVDAESAADAPPRRSRGRRCLELLGAETGAEPAGARKVSALRLPEPGSTAEGTGIKAPDKGGNKERGVGGRLRW